MYVCSFNIFHVAPAKMPYESNALQRVKGALQVERSMKERFTKGFINDQNELLSDII